MKNLGINALPPVLGQPNILVCLVENIFPPSLEISWAVSGVPVTAGVSTGPFVPSAELTFVRLSRVSVVPQAGDVHACVVT
uniref:Ig-like domain-containing protein n=1 Tax=Zosterops lateralis melanops TaxID=1220523 RepID=A0A8D2PS61_ZOSLA